MYRYVVKWKHRPIFMMRGGDRCSKEHVPGVTAAIQDVNETETGEGGVPPFKPTVRRRPPQSYTWITNVTDAAKLQ